MTGTPMKIPEMSEPNKEPFADKGTPSLPVKEKVIPPTLKEPPTDPPTKTAEQVQIEEYQKKEAAYQARQRDTDNKLTQLTQVVEKLVTDKNAPPPTTPEEDAKDFYRDPKKVIREVMQETVAPLNAFKDEFQGDSAYSRLKTQYKADPRFAAYFQRQGFEGMIDQVINQSMRNGVTISDEFVVSVLTHTAGQIAVGTVQMPDPIADANLTPTPTPGVPLVDERLIPPYLQPSSPPAVHRGAEPKRHRELTENEDRVRRERNMSVEDWWAWMELDSKDVIGSKIGIPQEAK